MGKMGKWIRRIESFELHSENLGSVVATQGSGVIRLL